MPTRKMSKSERNSMIAIGVMAGILFGYMIWLFHTLSYSANERQCIKAKNTVEYTQLKCEEL